MRAQFSQTAGAAVALCVLLLAAVATAGAKDPAVPPGLGSGGIPVAIIGDGIDYTQPHLASMLARDGEGEIIGYDFIDDDRRPFCTCGGTTIASIVVSEGQSATVVVIRATMANTAVASRAIRYAAESPAKITLFARPLADKADAALVSAAAAYFTKQLFIVPVADADVAAQVKTVPNLIVVSAVPGSGVTDAVALAADVAVPLDGVLNLNSAAEEKDDALPASSAAARVAALAARLQAVEPDNSPGQAKDRILKLANRRSENASGPPKISEPRRHFWLE